jgi:anthranilate phosphoribosyltransferase
MLFLPLLHRLTARENLSTQEAEQAMEMILTGMPSVSQVAAFLVAMIMKGETPDEMLGFARSMRRRAVRIDAGAGSEPLLDTCGTGGDGACTFNISTVTAFVVAGAGARVAKHGNRAISSRCGSADVLEELGVEISLEPERTAAAIREVGIGFVYAPAHHPAMRHVQVARSELKMRTSFNLLGPMTNPANASAQLVGAPSVRSAELMAQTLAALGLPRGFVVHGLDGLDEVSISGETLMLEIRSGAIAHLAVQPEDFGVARTPIEALRGSGPEENAQIALKVLNGERGPRRDVVLVNSAVALVAAGKAADFLEGMLMAAESIDSGAALRKLRELGAFTNGPSAAVGAIS